jgi:hypothetical protein
MGSGCVTVGVLPIVEWLDQSVGSIEEYAFSTEGKSFFMANAKVCASPNENAGNNARICLVSLVRRTKQTR